MVSLLAVLLNGVMISSVYALMAIGFTLIMGIRGILNLAHGGLIMIGAYAFLVGSHFLPLTGALIVAVSAAALVSYVLYAGLVRFTEQNVVITFMSTIVVALLLQQLMVIEFSSAPRTLRPLVSGGINVVGTHVRTNEMLGFALSWAAIGLLWYFVTRTKTGRAILATAMSEKGALLSGVNLGRVNAITWLVAGALAGLAGVFIGSLQQTSPTMWLTPLSLSFIIVVLGGVGSIKGSIVGAYFIGLLETVTVSFGDPSYRGLFSLVLLVVVVLVKPEGLFGREFIE